MSLQEIIDNVEWSVATRSAVLVSAISFVIGITLTDIHVLDLLSWSIFPLLLILFPWFWVWEVPRKYYLQPAPEVYVLVFGWAGVLYNAGRVLFEVYVNYS